MIGACHEVDDLAVVEHTGAQCHTLVHAIILEHVVLNLIGTGHLRAVGGRGLAVVGGIDDNGVLVGCAHGGLHPVLVVARCLVDRHLGVVVVHHVGVGLIECITSNATCIRLQATLSALGMVTERVECIAVGSEPRSLFAILALLEDEALGARTADGVVEPFDAADAALVFHLLVAIGHPLNEDVGCSAALVTTLSVDGNGAVGLGIDYILAHNGITDIYRLAVGFDHTHFKSGGLGQSQRATIGGIGNFLAQIRRHGAIGGEHQRSAVVIRLDVHAHAVGIVTACLVNDGESDRLAITASHISRVSKHSIIIVHHVVADANAEAIVSVNTILPHLSISARGRLVNVIFTQTHEYTTLSAVHGVVVLA